MFDTTKELLDKIRLGEDTFLELKEVRFRGTQVASPGRNDLADELAAMANGQGGVCVMGVDDGREVIGIPLELLDAVEACVHEVCADSIKPALVPAIERRSLPDSEGHIRAVLTISIDRSVYLHESPGGHFRRIGSSKRKMSTDQILRLAEERNRTRLISFDETVLERAELVDLVPDLYEPFRTELTRDLPRDFLFKLGMVAPDKTGELRPTVAGVLTASTDPTRWLNGAFIQAVAYRGTTGTPGGSADYYQLDAKDIVGPLAVQVTEACRFVERNMKVAARKSFGREDLPQYDLACILEAVVNAVAHRDYSIQGSKVRLKMFADRLEVYSPGGLPNHLAINQLEHRQWSRNQTIAALLSRSAIPAADWLPTRRQFFMDRRGDGVRIILEDSERLSGLRPEYRVLGESEVMLTIWAADPFRETASTTDNGAQL